LKSFPTGFHICGYDKRGIPEFWHFSNCNVGANFNYANVRSRFRKPSSDFLGRDAPQLGWDGKNPSSVKAKNVVQYYRNGDFKVHEAAWKKIDEVFRILYELKGFTRPTTNEDIERYVRFKLKFIGAVYQNWAYNKIVGGPFDVLVKNN